MHAPVTALDVLLPRIFADLEICREDFIRMGEGGLSLCQHWPQLG